MCNAMRGLLLLMVVGGMLGCGQNPENASTPKSAPQGELGEAGTVGDATGFEDDDTDAARPQAAEPNSPPKAEDSVVQAGIRATRSATTAAGVFVEDDRDEEDE